MKYKIDNDLHIHSHLSLCSGNMEQTPENILLYAKKNGLKTVCLTDHFWDETVEGASDWYSGQDYPHVSRYKNLPQDDEVKFLFGCETEMDRFMRVGISRKRIDSFDFVIIPTTHLHMTGYTISAEDYKSADTVAELWVKRFATVLDMDLPFKKIGIAHLTTGHIYQHDRAVYLEVLRKIPTEKMQELFTKAARLGIGIELNVNCSEEEKDLVFKPYKIAKECGCKFYMGSDSHNPKALEDAMAKFRRAVDELELEESDKFIIGG